MKIRSMPILVMSLLSSFIFSDIMMEIGVIDSENGTIEILIETTEAVSGFQFDLEGVNLTGGSGGLAEQNGFDIHASGDTALGFSLEGNVIPASSAGLLTVLSGEVSMDACLPFIQDVGPEDDTPILADSGGNALGNISIGQGACEPLSNGYNDIAFSLFETYPNPFNPKLNIDLIVNESANIIISAYNLNGQNIETIYNGYLVSNETYNFQWDATNFSSGIYIIKIEGLDSQYSKLVNLMK